MYVLSAEFGLIRSDHPIPNYDRTMTIERARALRSSVQCSLAMALDVFTNAPPTSTQLLLCLGRTYRETLADYAGPAAEVLYDRCIYAGQGVRLTLLRDWLRIAVSTSRE
jgi:hypothetical protein